MIPGIEMVTIIGFRGFKCRGLGCRGQPLVVRTRHLGFCHALKEQIACFSLACVEFIGRMQTVGGLYNILYILYTDPCYRA